MAGDGVRIRICHVDRNDGRHDDVLSDANDSHVCPCGPIRRAAEHTTCCNCLVCGFAGYFLVWVAFAVLATLVHWALERSASLDSAMASTSNILGGLVFVAAGSYQWTRLKDVCLTQCQMPFAFLMRHGGFRRDVPGCLLLGLRHGAYCVCCC